MKCWVFELGGQVAAMFEATKDMADQALRVLRSRGFQEVTLRRVRREEFDDCELRGKAGELDGFLFIDIAEGRMTCTITRAGSVLLAEEPPVPTLPLPGEEKSA